MSDAPITSVKPEGYQFHAEANAAMREAEETVHAAIAKLRSAASRYMRAEALVSDPDQRVDLLVAHAEQNRSTWSGGVLNPTNLVEKAKRDAALDLLRSRPFIVFGRKS